MKQLYIMSNHIARVLIASFLLLGLFSACSDDETSTVSFEKEELFLSPEKGTSSFVVRSNTTWELKTTAEWLSFNIPQGASNASVIVSYDAYTEEGVTRETDVIVTTTDGRASATIKLKQMPANSFIKLSDKEIAVEYEGGTQTIGLETNIPNLTTESVDFAINYADEDNSGWLQNVQLKDNELTFDVLENTTPSNRMVLLTISYTDEFDRVVEASVKVNQFLKRDPTLAVEKSFDYVRDMELGSVAENIYLHGVIVSDGQSPNFAKNRYTIQDVVTNKAVVFESDATLNLKRGDNVKLWLMGTESQKQTEDNFDFVLFKGIAANSILEKNKAQSLTIPEISISELTDDMLFSLVTLKDVEIAIPFGGLVNYNEYYVTGGGSEFPSLRRNYPMTIRDINGDYLYMLTNLEVPYRRETLPQGSGKVTGIVVREQNSNFGGDLGKYSIRHLQKEDINLAKDRSDGFSNILVEWDFMMPKDMPNGTKFIAPSVGPSDAIFFKNNSTHFDQAWIGDGIGQVYFIEEYRGDLHASGTNNTIKSAAVVSAYWGTNTWWIIKNISTAGITKPLSLQLETNSLVDTGPRDFIVEWSLDEKAWSAVPNGTYTSVGQTSSATRRANTIPGYKNININLPSELLGQSNIYLRLRATSTTAVNGTSEIGPKATSRIAHLSIKYNK